MEQINKVQINGQIKTDALGNILERSTLLNIRTDDVLEAIQLFNQLRLKMDVQQKVVSAPEPERLTAADIFPDSDEEENTCPECGSTMVRRNGKSGLFWGCSKFFKGCRGTRQI
ncbi:MAG: topoisomerase DNA-binding C4 zinc finger domain-containing protein [Candidatus Falkowbacteria bacterium]|nr:topoisomerase DNA-binding C4 zinc finger domain-containing protein [Candidatus Falkowbacteria bacterium]